MSEQVTLYTSQVSPYAHRVQIALIEAGIPHKTQEIQLGPQKPAWFAEKVNPLGLVPAITYGGPPTEPAQPSAESFKLSESLAIVEFAADLAAENPGLYKPLHPVSAVDRAKARFVVHAYFNIGGVALAAAFTPGGGECDYKKLFTAVDVLVKALNESTGKYIIGDQFTTADASIGPFVIRLELVLRAIGGDKAKEAIDALHSEKYASFQKYAQVLKERESFRKTFNEVAVGEGIVCFIARIRSLPAAK